MKERLDDSIASPDGRVQVQAPASWHAALQAAGLLEDRDLDQLPTAADSGYQGRGRPRLLRCEGRPAVVAKRLQHGGWVARFTREWFLGTRRLRTALRLLSHLVDHGVRTPPPVFGRVRRAALLRCCCRLDLGTVQVPFSRDLSGWLREGPTREERARVADGAGALVARMHAAGVQHADLNLKNLLVQVLPGDAGAVPGPSVFVIDLEGSRYRHGGVGTAGRTANLERLLRSFRKHGLLGSEVSRTDLVRFLRAYDPTAWKRWWRRVAGRHGRNAWRHRLSWWWQARRGTTPRS